MTERNLTAGIVAVAAVLAMALIAAGVTHLAIGAGGIVLQMARTLR